MQLTKRAKDARHFLECGRAVSFMCASQLIRGVMPTHEQVTSSRLSELLEDLHASITMLLEAHRVKSAEGAAFAGQSRVRRTWAMRQL